MKRTIINIKQNIRWIAPGLIIGFLAGWIFFHPGKGNRSNENQDGHEHSVQETTTWTCSMHPQIRQDKPGQCPICGMDLVPVQTMDSETGNADPDEIQMSESAARLADIQTTEVMRGTPVKELFMQGKVEPDERNIAELTARFGGRIEKLFVNFTGQNVIKGQKLATIYSPELVTAQNELLEAISYKESRPALYTAAKGKLRLWDLTEEQISGIEEEGEPQMYFEILSPITGTVMMRHVSLGDYVKEGNALFKVVDLTKVWVMFDAYESDLPWIKPGDMVDFTIPSLQGEPYSGRVTYIDPFIHPGTRVARVRVELNNPGLRIKPEMFIKGRLQSAIAESANEIIIPKSAALWTGKRAVVYVKVPDRKSPTFLYREITLGPEAGNFYVVSEGLREGEVIATNGVFKIDAASQLAGLPSMMNPEGGKVSLGHDHGSMSSGSLTDLTVSQTMEMNTEEYVIKAEFKEQLQDVYDSYVEMKDAFVASDANMVRDKAGILKAKLGEVDMGLLQGDAHMDLMEQIGKMNVALQNISDNGDIEEQRLAFTEFNDVYYQSIKEFGLHHGTVYYQYCPMANGDKGAFWFSNIREIRNPYFGEAMLSCGETRETLEF
jgi:Cu(I)/Ag(I) efflux system membrane fusion protein